MTRQYLNPLGFIDRLTETGATIILTNSKDSKHLEPGTPVTVWRYSRGVLALDRIRGEISRVGHTTASFIVAARETGPRWPQGQETLRQKTPVYLALKDSFEPDVSRMLSPEQAAEIARRAQMYTQVTGRTPKAPESEDQS